MIYINKYHWITGYINLWITFFVQKSNSSGLTRFLPDINLFFLYSLFLSILLLIKSFVFVVSDSFDRIFYFYYMQCLSFFSPLYHTSSSLVYVVRDSGRVSHTVSRSILIRGCITSHFPVKHGITSVHITHEPRPSSMWCALMWFIFMWLFHSKCG